MASQNFSNFIANLSKRSLAVLHPSFLRSDYIPIDLSVKNQHIGSLADSTKALDHYIKTIKEKYNVKIAYGGYLEERGIYRRSHIFNDENALDERNIHLGIDLWIEAGTPIFTPVYAKVHSFRNNNNLGDYGPTIILQHDIEGEEFYTLYGHLSLQSISSLKVGASINAGEQFGELGDASVNGDYPPHLHFQIIKDLQGYKGDYPGVCAKKNLDFFRENCPDPNLLLKMY